MSEEEVTLRIEVLEFAYEMEKVLCEHDAKKGDSWKTMPIHELHRCLYEEVYEYWTALTNEDGAKECIDTANILMMLYHRHKEEKKE